MEVTLYSKRTTDLYCLKKDSFIYLTSEMYVV